MMRRMKWYCSKREEAFFYAMGLKAVRSWIINPNPKRLEWKDTVTGKILGYQTKNGNYILL